MRDSGDDLMDDWMGSPLVMAGPLFLLGMLLAYLVGSLMVWLATALYRKTWW